MASVHYYEFAEIDQLENVETTENVKEITCPSCVYLLERARREPTDVKAKPDAQRP